MEDRVEALMDDIAVALMRAENLAAGASEYVVIAETLAYALDLADLGLSAESGAFSSVGPPKAQ